MAIRKKNYGQDIPRRQEKLAHQVAFDVTPNEFVTAIITEARVVKGDYLVGLKGLFG